MTNITRVCEEILEAGKKATPRPYLLRHQKLRFCNPGLIGIDCCDEEPFMILEMNSGMERTTQDQQYLHICANNADRLARALLVMEKALQFYAAGIPSERVQEGTRLEFGCGCCAGIETDCGSDCDDTVIGLTAREALAKANEILA